MLWYFFHASKEVYYPLICLGLYKSCTKSYYSENLSFLLFPFFFFPFCISTVSSYSNYFSFTVISCRESLISHKRLFLILQSLPLVCLVAYILQYCMNSIYCKFWQLLYPSCHQSLLIFFMFGMPPWPGYLCWIKIIYCFHTYSSQLFCILETYILPYFVSKL